MEYPYLDFFGISIGDIAPKAFYQKDDEYISHVWYFFGFVFDHTLSILPVRYYIINDSSSFEIMDFFSHVMYAPISYLFFYLYDLFHIKPNFTLLYILGWALVSVAIERICGMIGIFHYQHGYTIYYSFVIYLLVISIWIIFYRLIKEHGEKQY